METTKSLSDKEIEEQLKKSLKKVPFEMKKIKFILGVLKKINSIKKIFN